MDQKNSTEKNTGLNEVSLEGGGRRPDHLTKGI